MNFHKDLRIHLFIAAVESVLYGSEIWTLTKKLTQLVEECYTRMLRIAPNINQYTLKMKNSQPYENLSIFSPNITQRRLRLAGHAHHHSQLILQSVILWEPLHGHMRRGRLRMTCIGALRTLVSGIHRIWQQ